MWCVWGGGGGVAVGVGVSWTERIYSVFLSVSFFSFFLSGTLWMENLYTGQVTSYHIKLRLVCGFSALKKKKNRETRMIASVLKLYKT